MTNFSLSNPDTFSHKTRTVGIVAFPNAEVLDITGPFEVFNFANLTLIRRGYTDKNIYSLKLLAEQPGPVTTLSGLRILADNVYGDPNAEFDTLIIPGGDIEAILKNTALLDWIKAMSLRVRRLVSVCTGAFLLAEAGLLADRNATTHWDFCQQLADDYPGVRVKPDYIFIKDGHIFTSGGITSGIDLALALLEEDWGRDLALFVARYLVVFLKRPGGQSQFSDYLTVEANHRPDIRDLQAWIMQHIRQELNIDSLAERLAMSPRNFARLFAAETGMTPAKFVEMARIDRARYLLETDSLPVENIAEQTGFKDAERMRRAFIRQLGVNPQNYRARFSGSTTA
ncbi:GlxA family transcriptional regulator [Methylomonas sp. SURF-2]|uniref:GlxA family transcriptional regulator n=1 Tax=Methylomonas subterranea TaxID=2952225 RepID=A0ABT1TFN0_9GAMM|nr:GlxA family transcriptional regulator [Methylomonas sp. SURF-2]MCQ8103877.1 GlxA family transcriptional regulator [Methylomonas sp. SURF-2]